jgi:hypothetical protein
MAVGLKSPMYAAEKRPFAWQAGSAVEYSILRQVGSLMKLW